MKSKEKRILNIWKENCYAYPLNSTSELLDRTATDCGVNRTEIIKILSKEYEKILAKN